MTLVFRSYSPSREQGGPAYAHRARAVNQADVRNTLRAEPADWTVQVGTVEWEQP